jgi:ABC-type uncharacterized transport system substrate-binding protein
MTIAGVLEKIISGKIDELPPVTSLNQIKVTTNQAVMRKLGLVADAPVGNDAVVVNQ